MTSADGRATSLLGIVESCKSVEFLDFVTNFTDSDTDQADLALLSGVFANLNSLIAHNVTVAEKMKDGGAKQRVEIELLRGQVQLCREGVKAMAADSVSLVSRVSAVFGQVCLSVIFCFHRTHTNTRVKYPR